MSEFKLRDGTGSGRTQKVTSTNRGLVQGLNEHIAAERSRTGKLYGLGTGGITPTGSFSLGRVLWLQNDDPNTDVHILKLIFGWNGGSTNFNRTIFSLIHYQETVPTGANTSITASIENISRSGTTAAVTDSLLTAHKWDGTGTGMTGMTGGFSQIPNRLAQGDTEKFIDGQIILGQGDTMSFGVTPEQTGLFHVSVVYYRAPSGGIEAE